MKKDKKVVLTYYFTGMMDKWHHLKYKVCDNRDFDTLFDSVKGRGYDFVTLANELEPDREGWSVAKLEGKLAKPEDMSLYVHKFIACYEYLLQHPEYEEIWIVDSADTEMLGDPKPKEGIIYTGYDAYKLEFDRWVNFIWFLGGEKEGLWIKPHFGVGKRHGDAECQYLRDTHPEDIPYNCGVFGGKREIVMEFLEKYVDRLKRNDIDLEMVPFNFLAYTIYDGRVESCTTRMTMLEKDYNKWWRHK